MIRKTLVLPAGKLATVHVTVPPDPTFGVEQVHIGPDVCCSETNVMSLGRVSFRATVDAASGPAFATWIVKVTFLSARV